MAEYEEEDYVEATPEQKLAIATYFIQSTPTGEVSEVIKDLKNLVGGDVLSKGALQDIMRDYNLDQMTIAPNNGRNAMVSPYGMAADDEFLDPHSGIVYKYDHVGQKWGAATDQKQVLDATVDKFRTAIHTEIETYMSSCYKAGKYGFAIYGTDEGQITICISAANIHLGNFWTGGFKSVYTLNVSNGASAEMKGNLKINVHYFENGNVQLHTDDATTHSISIRDPTATAMTIAKTIEDAETAYQNNLEEMYVNMHGSTFKSMRRFLPVHGEYMKWTAAAHMGKST
jgi:capping protein alpha